MRDLLAKLHEDLGTSSFRLYYNLRKPTSRQEVWAYQHFHGNISADELRERMKAHAARPVDQAMVDEAYRQLETWLQYYSRALQAAAETLKSGCPPKRRERLERIATKSLARTEGRFSLASQELDTLVSFVDEMRLQRGLGLAAVGDQSATNAIHLALLIFRNAVLNWESCSRIAEDSRTNPNYLNATTAASLLFRDDAPKLPTPQNLMALLTQERSAATITLAEPARASKATELSEAVINVKTATINVDELQSKVAETKTEKDSQKLSVSSWSNLAIGIDEHRRYWALAPAPLLGGAFPKSNATRLQLGGRFWRPLMDGLSESPSGNAIPINEAIAMFGLLAPGSTVKDDSRARPGKVRGAITSELNAGGSVVRAKLSDKLKHLGRTLRNCVDGPTGKEDPSFWLEDEHVRSGFTVQCLIRDASGSYTFGLRRNHDGE